MTEPLLEPVPWLILLPLGWAALAYLQGPGRGARVAIAAIAIQLALALELARQLLVNGVAVSHRVGGWGAPLGIELVADGLSAVMLLMTQAVVLPLAIFARAYFTEGAREGRYFWPLTGFLLAAMNALYLSADLFNLYVSLELLGLAAVGLVAAGGAVNQLTAALRYLFATMIASGAYLLGVALLYGAYGAVALSVLTPLIAGQAPVAWSAAGLMLVGLMLKTALFPLHFWLPPAHGGAPAPVSALLSGLMVKATFYLILRLWLGIFAPLVAFAEAVVWLPGLLGAAAILWGSVKALRARRLKMLVAYSTVAQIGYLFLIFPLLVLPVAAPVALRGGVLYAVAHALAKAAMFAAAGVLVKASGQETVAGLAGMAGRVPLSLFAFGVAGVTLMGLPPSGGFLAKWLLIEAALAQGLWGWAAVVIAGGLLAAGYVFRVFRQAFLSAPAGREYLPVPRSLEWAAFGLAAASALLGLRAMELLALLAMGRAA